MVSQYGTPNVSAGNCCELETPNIFVLLSDVHRSHSILMSVVYISLAVWIIIYLAKMCAYFSFTLFVPHQFKFTTNS